MFDQTTLTNITVSPESLDVDTRTGTVFVGGGNTPASSNRRIFALTNVLRPGTGYTINYGTGCNDSGGSPPRLGVSDVIQTGRTFDLAVQTTCLPLSPATAYFFLGVGQVNIDLGIIGFPGCPLLASPTITTIGPLPLNANRRAGLTIGGIGAGLAGATLNWQAVLAPDIGSSLLVTSNGTETRIQ